MTTGNSTWLIAVVIVSLVLFAAASMIRRVPPAAPERLLVAELLENQRKDTGEWIFLSDVISINPIGYGVYRRTSWYSDGTQESYMFRSDLGKSGYTRIDEAHTSSERPDKDQ